MSTRCQNCATPLQGDFCWECGQSTADFDLPVVDFAGEFAREAFSLDSRLRLTLKPLFLKPGAVPKAYVTGHRARFVPPIRLYIFASFAMFLLMTLGPGVSVNNISVDAGEDRSSSVDSAATPLDSPTTDSVTVAADSVASVPEPAADAASAEAGGPDFGQRLQGRLVRGLQRVDENRGSFSREFFNRLAQSMIFLLPAFAVLLKLTHRRRLLVHHLVFAIYHHTFVFFVVAFVAVAPALRLEAVSSWTSFALLTIPVYLLLGMKRFYDESWVKTVFKFVFVSMTYFFVGALTALGVLVVSLLSI